MIQAVIFDMDGVLVDSEPLWQRAIIDSFQSIGITLTVEEALEIQGMRIDALVAYFHQRYRWQQPSRKNVERLIIDSVIALIKQNGQPKDGAIEALAFTSGKVEKVGLASSSPTRVIQAVMDRLAISDTFDIIHSAEHEPYGKPHPAVYLSAAQKLNTPPAACLAIEDSMSGLLSAVSAGMKCLCVPDPSLYGDPRLSLADTTIRSLADLDQGVWGRLTNGQMTSAGRNSPDAGPPYSTLVTQSLDEISRVLAAIDEAQLDRIAAALRSHRRIFVTGRGRTGLQMQAFAMRLAQLGLTVHVVGEVTTPAISAGDCLLVGSGSGQTSGLVDHAGLARSAGAQVCLLTASDASPLFERSDQHVIIPALPSVNKLKGAQSDSMQPLGTLFETCLGIVLDILCLQLMAALGVTASQMADRHANLE